jgi:2-polyprenyl-3-methyl-5-hydroxy-6-metoxy-1,4-benzoquinol methylase
MNVESPITGSANVVAEGERSVARIVKEYARFGMDVSPYFGSRENIKVFRCQDTGYGFYYPLTLSGDGKFYETLQKFDWYYMPWKWEHEMSLEYVNDGAEILEVGCGQAAYLDRLSTLKKVRCTGLEINETAIRDQGSVRVLNETVEKHALLNSGKYDVACSFEVLEHIAGVRSFINGQIDCLKNDGLLIISVPNNESFMSSDPYAALNMPPHHMGLWDTTSLKNLEKEFPISLVEIRYEPLQTYHFESYIISRLKKNLGTFLTRVTFKIIKVRPLHRFIFRYLEKRKHRIMGHTILAVYRKSKK